MAKHSTSSPLEGAIQSVFHTVSHRFRGEWAPIENTCLMMRPFGVISLSSLLTPLLTFFWVTSQIKYLYSNHYLKVCFWRNLNNTNSYLVWKVNHARCCTGFSTVSNPYNNPERQKLCFHFTDEKLRPREWKCLFSRSQKMFRLWAKEFPKTHQWPFFPSP